MSKNKRVLYNLIIKNFFRLITVIPCFFYLLEHDVTHIVGAIVFLLTSLGVDIVFKLINVKLTSIIDLTVQVFIFLCLFLGKMCDMYIIFSWWDSFLHFISGIIIGIGGILALRILLPEEVFFKLSVLVKTLNAFLFSVASSALWEIWEFAGDQLFGFNSQLNSLTDTMIDICACTLGGIIISILIYRFYKKGTFRFIGEIVEQFSKINAKNKKYDNKF